MTNSPLHQKIDICLTNPHVAYEKSFLLKVPKKIHRTTRVITIQL